MSTGGPPFPAARIATPVNRAGRALVLTEVSSDANIGSAVPADVGAGPPPRTGTERRRRGVRRGTGPRPRRTERRHE